MMKPLFLSMIAIGLAGCGATQKVDVRNETEASQYDPASMARIRLFAQGMVQGGYISGRSCEAYYNDSGVQSAPEKAGWKEGDEHLGEFLRKDENSVVGMPASKSTAEINQSRLYYNEHVVPANRPLIVEYRAGSPGSVYCKPFPIIFTPQPGQDYEVWYLNTRNQFNQSACAISLQKIMTVGGATVEQRVIPQACIGQRVGEYKTADPFVKAEYLRQPESTVSP